MDKETAQWTDMAAKMANTWTEMGTQMWKSWFDLMAAVPTPEQVSAAKPEVKTATERFISNRDLFVRFLELSASAWKDMLPKVESGGDWQSILNSYNEQLRQQFGNFPMSAMKTSQDTAQLWQLYMKEMQTFSQLWGTPLGLSLEPWSKVGLGDTSGLLELNNLYWDLYQRSLGGFVKAPGLGQNRELSAKLMDGFDAWTKLYKANLDYQVVISDVQIRSFDALMKKLVALAEKGQKVENWRDFQGLWSQVADDVFAEAFKSEDNLKLRGNFINALNAYRVYQQELMELNMKMLNAPIRSEVDEIHQSIYELKKEIKALKKQLS
ncbi:MULTISPECIES: class III poly(R)-hydroxyalkanoic acid synthase subunit PhaE [Planktothricoides]|uniref:Poly(3-hydroxyalkanoate) polymerase subunit PhaE n=2 Tax=Planktothricoides raciborskii TaxID=132608 RepID=A0AAU8J731_9CYAN|nr:MULTISPECIES: class III poly(R)-hydroxyalkanoic acid synthase subunit PhaE [Planktothricoides]KOR35030.1 poly(3-hydroxyalkanoate) synthase [Planktothricoides sp. SR001]MBD2546809.1 class III poly(R)-hydroxyalkanoic acid synthase subunit PhaE [Planktothricoides raciborskii FACHB-1370]MBD2583074.1 class III poly(R)-hydroxyalkanoic acid synthase subunit PhaE [Planktothricoides raciborskii FACHB-1261]